MIAWIECSGRLPYLAGIVATLDEARLLQAAMPAQVAQLSRIAHRHDLDWPCFVVESSHGFAFCTPGEVTALIAAQLRAGSLDDEDQRVTVYHIVGPFLPDQPGRDEMGRLPHTHAGASDTARIAAEGIDCFLRGNP